MFVKVAVILPALVNKGPVSVAKDIIEGFAFKYPNYQFDIFYFDKEVELDFVGNSNNNINLLKFHSDLSDYDIIHSHMLRPDFYIWLNRKKLKNTVKISTLHQDIFMNLSSSYNVFVGFLMEYLWFYIFRPFNKVIVLSNVMKEKYKSRIDRKLLHTIYNGRAISDTLNIVDDELIKSLKSKYKIIGVTALLTKRKGIHQLIEAIKFLPEYALVIIGNGIEYDNLVSLANKMKVSDRCLFLGYKKNAIDYLELFDLYAMTSYSEGFPLSLLEAGQKNLPIVCSDIPLFRELFNDEEVCFFNLDNIESLVLSIQRANDNKDSYAQNVNEKILSNYSVGNMVDEYYSIYQQAIKENRK